MLWVGVAYALSGNLLNSVGIQLQRLTHMQNKDNVPYLKLPLWWLGLACMAAGEAGIVMAYGEAPASIVAVLGSVSVISNTLMSWLLLKEIINYAAGNFALIARGRHRGISGEIKEILPGTAARKSLTTIGDLQTPTQYVFIIGKDKPQVEL